MTTRNNVKSLGIEGLNVVKLLPTLTTKPFQSIEDPKHLGKKYPVYFLDPQKNPTFVGVEQVSVVQGMEDSSVQEKIVLPQGKDSRFITFPNVQERNVILVWGMSGSGKSFWTKQFIDNYKLIHGESKKIVVFAAKPPEVDDVYGDPSSFEYYHPTDNFPTDMEYYTDTLVVFDDTELHRGSYVGTLLEQLMKENRVRRTTIVGIFHNPFGGTTTVDIINECDTIVFFPNSQRFKTIEFFNRKFNMNIKTLNEFFATTHRAAVYVKEPDMMYNQSVCFITKYFS